MKRPEVIRYHRCAFCRDLCPAWRPLCWRCRGILAPVEVDA